LLKKNGIDPQRSVSASVSGATAVAAMEQARSTPRSCWIRPYRPARQPSGPAHSQRYATQNDTLAVFGGEYPGGALYSTTAWVNSHEKDVQALTNAIVNTLTWIHTHSPEEIMAKMPAETVGKNKELYLAALKNTIPMYSETGKMDPKGADAVARGVQRELARSRQGQYRCQQDLTNNMSTAKKTTGMNAK